jgi:hypothetical protein
LGTLIAFFRARRGAARGFRLKDPTDFSSNGMVGAPGATDQVIGTGDGVNATFALTKTYGLGIDEPQVPDHSPRGRFGDGQRGWRGAHQWLDIAGRGQDPVCQRAGQWRGGACRILFDVPVRFEQDRLDVTGTTFASAEAASVPVVEIREAV